MNAKPIWLIRQLVGLSILVGTLFSAGCNNLMYMERTGFNLGVFVNADPAKPIKVNTGLERAVATIAPSKADGSDSVSMVSFFGLTQTDTGWINKNTLTIKTDFASGTAATEAKKSDEAGEIFSQTISDYADTALTQRINSWVAADKAGNLEKLRVWLDDWNSRHNTSINEIDMRRSSNYEKEQSIMVSELQVPE